MTYLTNKFSTLLLNGLLMSALVLTTACGQKPETDAEVVDDVAPATEVEAVAPGVQSIDADGNVAPFGMASKKPVSIAAVEAVDAAEGPANSVLFVTNCSACHGPDAMGVEGLGLNLVTSELVANATEAELVEFLQDGRAPDSSDSITGVPMPSFAWMSDADLLELSGYLKNLQ